ncbi:MAG: BatA domain-containing protein [Isosphaeraceae bacterium]|nr:BatA domain-containing protein [Isosphaeraceae bacterium]
MDISLLHAGLAGGAALAALPVILHLFMKQTPKRIVFPALRLIRERQKRSRKKLKVKNWLLLIARMAILALMALALARPSFFSKGKLGADDVPTALALVFDTSLSMGYKEHDKTRLDEAKDWAYETLKKTPDSSQVFVIDSSQPGVPPPLSPASARKQIEGLALRATYRPLNAAVGQAYSAVVESDRPRHEVYVLTDLARSAWKTDSAVEGLDKLQKIKNGVNTYVVRLAPKDVRDIAVTEAEPSASVATQGDTIEIRAKIRSQGAAVTPVAEFFLDGVPKDKKPVAVPANGETEVKFVTPKLDPRVPLHQGFVRFSGAIDSLAFDDTRYFTFKVEAARKVLVIADLLTEGANDAEFIADALDPDPATLPPGTPRACKVTRIRARDLTDRDREAFKDYSCIFVNNVSELKEEDWGKLNAYVREGGGLTVGLGDRCTAGNYNGPNASQVVPAKLERKSNPEKPTTFGKVNDFTHPLFTRYAQNIEADLSQVPVRRYWHVVPSEGARVLLSYADGSPALLERTLKGEKTGRVLLWTTPLARRSDPKADAAWNEFPMAWPFLAALVETVPYMAGATGERLNYTAGDNVILAVDPTRRFKNYFVRHQEGKNAERLTAPVTNDSLVIEAPTPPGQWTVTATGPETEKEEMGFSINPPLGESEFVPLEKGDLDHLFGKDKYVFADDTKALAERVKDVRFGRELFPWIMALILIVVTLENLLANKFHRESGAKVAAGAAA